MMNRDRESWPSVASLVQLFLRVQFPLPLVVKLPLIETHQNSSQLITTHQNSSKLITPYPNSSRPIQTHHAQSKLIKTHHSLSIIIISDQFSVTFKRVIRKHRP